MQTIVLYDINDYERDFFNKELGNNYKYIYKNYELNDNTQLDKTEENAQIISVFTSSRLKKETLEKFNNLKLILTRSVGYSHIDTEYCNKKGIIVANTPHYGDYTVAEFSFGILLNLIRKICSGIQELKQGDMYPEMFGTELYDKTIGIIGTGSIGSKSIKIAKGFSMNVICYDIAKNPDIERDFDIKYSDIDTLCRQSDIIMLHAPLNEGTYHIINKNRLDLMKRTAVIVNTARGELIDTESLYDALLEKRIKGAALDVLEFEETISNKKPGENLNFKNLRISLINNKLLNLDNVVATPHIAYDTKEAIDRILYTTLRNLTQYLQGHKLTNKII